MTRVLQFTAPNPPASVLVQLMVLMLNNASNIARLSREPGYGTRPFMPSDFGCKYDDPNTYWIDYDATLPHLTDYGRTLMQSLIEGVSLDAAGNIVPAPSGKGMLQMAPMVAGTEIKLRLVDVEDLALGGYIALPSGDTAPVQEPEPLQFAHVGPHWVYLACSTQEFNRRFNALPEAKRNNPAAKFLTCPRPAHVQWPCFLLFRPDYNEVEHEALRPDFVTPGEPAWLNPAKSTAAWPL